MRISIELNSTGFEFFLPNLSAYTFALDIFLLNQEEFIAITRANRWSCTFRNLNKRQHKNFAARSFLPKAAGLVMLNLRNQRLLGNQYETYDRESI